MTPLCTISSRECEWGQSIQIEFWYWSTGYLIKNNFLSSCCSSFVEIQQTLAHDLTFDIKIPSHDLYIIIYVCTHNISCSWNFFSQQGQKQICTSIFHMLFPVFDVSKPFMVADKVFKRYCLFDLIFFLLFTLMKFWLNFCANNARVGLYS